MITAVMQEMVEDVSEASDEFLAIILEIASNCFIYILIVWGALQEQVLNLSKGSL